MNKMAATCFIIEEISRCTNENFLMGIWQRISLEGLCGVLFDLDVQVSKAWMDTLGDLALLTKYTKN